MRLCDVDIEKWIIKKKLIIDPLLNFKEINGATIDVHLSKNFRIFKNYSKKIIDLGGSPKKIKSSLKEHISNEIYIPEGKSFLLKPKKFVLGMTVERISTPNNLVGWLDGRSSLARLGLMVHMTSHRIDPGWNGNIVLEFFNAGEHILGLSPGMAIAALSFEILSGVSRRPYNYRKHSKYLNQSGILSSLIYKE
ncbi:MAG: dCTP deaminase [Buchnera aphidicola (Periphyllus lyropictus)]|uniref:dCTP deaminase n=1 Tax=Buchnera aphidicola TaxID=9 RepID=UPI001ECE1F64|nr:dCTP deaminase [Buchnera aphidicola]NIH16719.1 dCTP deaminase [Buchnera aphidicola (Periphyllus lyropictus)]USS94624.1 dCTP deaminase [Buchnera aphidicola (Periphyllus lyropictus)]